MRSEDIIERYDPQPAEGGPEELRRKIVRATFNAAAPHFDAAPLFFWDRCGERTVQLAGVALGDRVLDVCCGTGASALPAAQRVGPTGLVVGVDLADRALDKARDKAASLRLGNVRFTVGDMDRLDALDGSMDVVVCVFGVYFARDLVGTLSEWWRVVRPGGVLAVTTWGARPLEPANTMYLEAVAVERPELSVDPTAVCSDAAALIRAFVDAGAPAPELVEETIVHPMGPDDFWSVVLGSGYRVVVDAIGAESAERVRAALHRRMNEQGVREVTADVLYVRARKLAASVGAVPASAE